MLHVDLTSDSSIYHGGGELSACMMARVARRTCCWRFIWPPVRTGPGPKLHCFLTMHTHVGRSFLSLEFTGRINIVDSELVRTGMHILVHAHIYTFAIAQEAGWGPGRAGGQTSGDACHRTEGCAAGEDSNMFTVTHIHIYTYDRWRGG